MTSNLNISARANKALDILADGGEFVYRLERNSYTGREQFVAKLFDANRDRVRGFSYAVLDELKREGLLVTANSTSVSTYYRMNRGAA